MRFVTRQRDRRIGYAALAVRAGLLPLSILALLGGCEARLALGAGCALASECPAPLACVAGRCRSECANARDCPRGAICVRGGAGVSACQLEDGGDACAATSACGGRLVCLEGRCTEDCVTDGDCLAGAVCHPAAGCVECVSDGDCPRTLRCGEAHRCQAECATDGDCAAGLVCAGERCVLPPADGGAPDAPGRVLLNDRCADAATITLPPAPFGIVYRARASGWTDDVPSCTGAADGYFRFETPGRVLAHVGNCAGSGPSRLAPIADCASAVSDCALILAQHAHYVMPDAQLFAYDLDDGTSEADVTLCVEGIAMGGGTSFDYLDAGAVDRTLVLDGEGAGECGSTGPDAIFAVVVGAGAGTAMLAAEAPGIDLAWQDAGSGACGAFAAGRAEHAIGGFVDTFEYARLLVRGGAGPVTVHVTGTVTRE